MPVVKPLGHFKQSGFLSILLFGSSAQGAEDTKVFSGAVTGAFSRLSNICFWGSSTWFPMLLLLDGVTKRVLRHSYVKNALSLSRCCVLTHAHQEQGACRKARETSTKPLYGLNLIFTEVHLCILQCRPREAMDIPGFLSE